MVLEELIGVLGNHDPGRGQRLLQDALRRIGRADRRGRCKQATGQRPQAPKRKQPKECPPQIPEIKPLKLKSIHVFACVCASASVGMQLCTKVY